MADDSNNSSSLTGTELVPVRQHQRLWPADLPSSSGASWGSRNRILLKDTAYVRHHADFLNGRIAQAHAMGALVEARIALSLSLSKLGALPEIIAAEYLKGRRERAREVLITDLRCQEAELRAKAAVASAHKLLESINPPPQSPEQLPATPPPPQPSGLTPDEIDELVAGGLPEIDEETRRTLSLLLRGRLQEKNA